MRIAGGGEENRITVGGERPYWWWSKTTLQVVQRMGRKTALQVVVKSALGGDSRIAGGDRIAGDGGEGCIAIGGGRPHGW